MYLQESNKYDVNLLIVRNAINSHFRRKLILVIHLVFQEFFSAVRSNAYNVQVSSAIVV